MKFALNKAFIKAANVKIDLITGKAPQTRHKHCHEVLHVTGMGHDSTHDQAYFSFEYAPKVQNNVAIFPEPTDK
jgi:hypothetical protein